MEQQLRKQLSAMFLDTDAGNPGIRHLQAEQMLRRHIQYMCDDHANHTGMGDNQQRRKDPYSRMARCNEIGPQVMPGESVETD